jgi:hypothetical protein
MASPVVTANFNGGYIKAGFSPLGFSHLKYTLPSKIIDDKSKELK